MRILHINKFNYRRGGAEAYMLDTMSLQRDAGHDVAVFAMDHPDNDRSEFEANFPSYIDFERPPERLTERARAAARMIWSRTAAAGAERTIEAFRPDVAHLHNIYHQLSPSVLRPLRQRGVPTVMTLHDFKLVCPSHEMLDHGRPCEACLPHRFHQAVLHRCKNGSLAASSLLALESGLHRAGRLYGGTDLFICPSQFLLQKMRAGGVFPERLRVLPSFTDAVRLSPKTVVGGPVVFAGRLVPQKGVDVLIEAVASMSEDTRVVIVGDGPARQDLERQAAQHCPTRVEFVGRLNRLAVLELMRSALAVVLPSRAYENQPLVVLEAQALGVPVIGSDIGGIPELVVDGATGWTVRAGDPASLRAALATLVGDPARAMAMGRAGREAVLSRFSPEAHLEQLEGLYTEAAVENAARFSLA
jgi:glycosyltransferase involved in cell wall biosynthesis